MQKTTAGSTVRVWTDLTAVCELPRGGRGLLSSPQLFFELQHIVGPPTHKDEFQHDLQCITRV